MAKSIFHNIAIRGLAAAVPHQRVRHLTDHTFLEEKERRNIVALTGIEEYRRASDDICASDLCAAAATSLLQEVQVAADSIDAVIFTSMTPDYVIPSTACLLQDRLGLPITAIAYDINM